MFATISGCLLLISSTVATPFQLVAPSLLNASSHGSTHGNTSASTSNASNNFQCFDPSFPPPGPFYPIKYSGCTDAASKVLPDLRGNVPLTFSRGDNADIQLPSQARSGNCVMGLDVLEEDDEDIIGLQDAHGIALALCTLCVKGYYRYGGKTPVGPRGVVQISVLGTMPLTVDAAGPVVSQPSQTSLPQFERRGPVLFNTSSLDITGKSMLNVSTANKGECFSKSGPSPRRHLYPVKSLDCFNAADEMMKNRREDAAITFGRRAGMDFKLPWRARNKSCIVTIDVLNDIDFDEIVLWEVYATALDRIEECTTGENIFGGSRVVGSKNVVYVYVFGIGSPLQMASPALPAPTLVVAREQIENRALNLFNASSMQPTEPLSVTSAPTTNAPTLRGIPECYDPPSPRERSVPISNFADCEAATKDVVGTRTRSQVYVFSRKLSADPDHYQLPATFRTRTCVVHLDMEPEDAEDPVRLGFVESTAYVLAHKCSGLEEPEEKWGGTMTVSVGASDLIRVWVYGVLPPTLAATSPSRAASLLESE
ncbi:MAG: hypothetical protein ALECFALPRED_009216 [Alectoria fallacina]|uniref:Uncharacterized protein n=1 Tax=Alectoria fallacina TaxID=1903189 RepID=A0A8H3F145_9LECA|nr:MAG: hypothetical protein ALECFALPRED_009216 [Alectoria fallacina]